MLITPGCIAYLLTDRFGRMLWIATGSAVFSSLAGVYVSFFLNGSTAACIVLVQALIFLARPHLRAKARPALPPARHRAARDQRARTAC